MKTLGERAERTLARAAEIAGVGLITGRTVRMRLLPAAEGHGIQFRRTDLQNAELIPARVEFVSDTRRRTTLGTGDNCVTLAEHVLAALAGMRIDNCLIELDGPEPPGLDGSAAGFVQAVRAAGILAQASRRAIRGVRERLVLQREGATISLHPAEGLGLRVSYILDYGPYSPLPRQSCTLSLTAESFAAELASSRTFLLEQEVATLHQQGIGRHLTAADLLVFGRDGPLGKQLRFGDEPARHKVLDLVGDLSLCGFDLAGHVVAYRSGHTLNVELARELARQSQEATASPAVLTFRRLIRRAA